MVPYLAVNPTTGEVTYTPTTGYSGPDSFTFKVTDTSGQDSNTATVSITVENQAPTADGQSVTTPKNTALPITLTGTDPDTNDPVSFTIVTGPAHGSLSAVNPTTGEVTYTPTTGYSGPDSFTFKVTDTSGQDSNTATVSITVENQAPTANGQSVTTPKNTALPITLTGTDPDTNDPVTFSIVTGPTHGTLSGFNPTTGEVTYTPTTGYSGPDSFTFKVTDTSGQDSNTATVSITVENQAPTADGQSVTTPKNTVPSNHPDRY